jgi:hypothetical protein
MKTKVTMRKIAAVERNVLSEPIVILIGALRNTAKLSIPQTYSRGIQPLVGCFVTLTCRMRRRS